MVAVPAPERPDRHMTKLHGEDLTRRHLCRVSVPTGGRMPNAPFIPRGPIVLMRIGIRVPLGIGLTALGTVALREELWTVAASGSLSLGLVLLLVTGWLSLECERDRLLRSSAEHWEKVLSWTNAPDPLPLSSQEVHTAEPGGSTRIGHSRFGMEVADVGPTRDG